MKKVFLALILLATAFVFFGTRSYAAGTGNLVVHFQKWDGDYSAAGFNSWGDGAMPGFKDPSQMVWQTDDFGIYVEINGIAVGTEGNLGVQVVKFDYNATSEAWAPNWDTGKMANVEIPRTKIEEDKTIHVYLFEGGVSRETGEENFAFPIYADPDTQNMMIVYFDPSNSYEENLGVHSWGWVESAADWNDPQKIFTKVGRATDGSFVYAGILQFSDPVGTPGAIVYYGDGDDSKKTGNLEPKKEDNAAYIETLKTAGQADVVYVVNKGNANTSNNNVWVNNPATFSEEAFSFRFVSYQVDQETGRQSGTYAVNPTTILVGLNQQIASPLLGAEDEEAAMETIKNWFNVREVTGVDTYGAPLAIERIDFAQSSATLKDFVIILEDELDNTKDYEVFFNLNLPEETLTVAKQVEVTINVTVPANTPVDAVIKLAGNVNGWNPEHADFGAVKVGTSLVYTLTFTVDVTAPVTNYSYKWTRGDWPNEEFIASNRPLTIPNNVDSITFYDVVEAWKDIDAPAEQYAAPERKIGSNLKASIELAMDTEKPVLTFISPSGIVGKVPAERIINVAWGQPFNQNLFPRFRVVDDRDGDITSLVYVPKGSNSVLDTRTVGDYTIMLRVVDKWGNVTEETFIFRVAKSS